MADRTCDKCGQVFTFPCRLRDHLGRKTPCAPTPGAPFLTNTDQEKPYPCRFCGRRFTSINGRSQHVRKYCKYTNKKGEQAIAPGQDDGDRETTGADEPISRPSDQQTEILTLRRRLTCQEEKLRELEMLLKATVVQSPSVSAETVTQSAHQIDNSSNKTVNNITLNIFGKEDLSHLDRERIRVILHDCASGLPQLTGQRLPEGESHPPEVRRAVNEAAKGVLRVLLTEAYANPDHPENLTMYIPNKKEQQVLCHAGEGSAPVWRQLALEALTPLVQAKVLDHLSANQPWEAPTREKLHQYGLLIRGTYDYDRPAFGRLIRTVVLGNKALLKALDISVY